MRSFLAFLLLLLTTSACGLSVSEKTLSADILLPSEVQTLEGTSLVLTVANSSDLQVVWGPDTLQVDTEGFYAAELGALPEGNYLAQVSLQIPHTEPQLAESLPSGLTTSKAVDIAYAIKTLMVTRQKTILLSFTAADFAFDLDPDGDSLFSLNEYLNGLDPFNADTDGDGMPDYADIFPLDLSETIDEDSDGMGNGRDNCPFLSNSDQADHEGDGKGDVCDPDDDNDGLPDDSESSMGSDPFNPDTDHDGIGDGSDNCLLTANPDQVDTNLDGSGNTCDEDDDGDGVPDIADNCSLIQNADQTDADEDGLGDACVNDDDGDGIMDDTDNCHSVPNPQQTDTDGDLLGDTCDADDDNDGLSDTEESGLGEDHLITDVLVADSDQDGLTDAGDNCPLTANLQQTDSDRDGEGDACDCDPKDASIRIRNAIFVSPSGNNTNKGAQNSPLKTIARAIAFAEAEGSSVYLTAGTYEESVSLMEGVSLYGGFGVGSNCRRDLTTNISEITSSSSITITAQEILSTTILDGLKITNTSPSSVTVAGMAVRIQNFTPISLSPLIIRQSRIFGPDNRLGESIGLEVDGASPTLENNVIYSGASLSSQAVLLKNSPAAKLWHNTIRGGSSSDNGTPSAITVINSSPMFVNNILTTDLGKKDQRLVSIDDSSSNTRITLKNNLLVGTPGGYSPKLYRNRVGGGLLFTSIDEINALGDGIENNLSTELPPSALFDDYARHDYHLKPVNPAIDAGLDPSSLNVPISSDLENTPRPQGRGYDIGAFEF